jgi:hypothetical protein
MNYTKFSDRDLFESYQTALDYSGKADKNLIAEIENRGGVEKLREAFEKEKRFSKEIYRIYNIVYTLRRSNMSEEEILSQVTSEVIPKSELVNLVRNHLVTIDKEMKDASVNARTIIGAILGTTISSILTAILWYASIVYSGYMYYILIGVFVLMSYVIIRLCTRQSRRNVVVFIATFLSVFIGMIVGTLLCM